MAFECREYTDALIAITRAARRKVREGRGRHAWLDINDQDLADFFGVSQSKYSRVFNQKTCLSGKELFNWAEKAGLSLEIV